MIFGGRTRAQLRKILIHGATRPRSRSTAGVQGWPGTVTQIPCVTGARTSGPGLTSTRQGPPLPAARTKDLTAGGEDTEKPDRREALHLRGLGGVLAAEPAWGFSDDSQILCAESRIVAIGDATESRVRSLRARSALMPSS